MRHSAKLTTLLLAAATVGCGESLGPNGEQLVAVSDNAFGPLTREIKRGETVLWEWKGSNQHNITWVAADAPQASPTQATGTYSRTFSAAGTYIYYCSIHGSQNSGMYGVVRVPGSSGNTGY